MRDRDPNGTADESGEAAADESASDGSDETPSSAEPTAGETGDVPLSNLRETVEERRSRSAEVPSADEVFEAVSDEPVVDGEQVWTALLEGEDANAGMVAFAETVEEAADDVSVIPDRICHSCPYFGEPPELHCDHEGTTIRRMVDMTHYEVVECPVVADRPERRDE